MVGETFQIHVDSRWFDCMDMIENKLGIALQVIGEPEEQKQVRKSRWWIVNWWRKLTGTQRYISTWLYTVKPLSRQDQSSNSMG